MPAVLYQTTVKDVLRYNLFDMIISISHNPHALFKTIDAVLSAQQKSYVEASYALFFSLLYKGANLPSCIWPLYLCPLLYCLLSIWSCPLAFFFLQEIVGHLVTSGSPNNSIPHYLKKFSLP